MNGKSIGACKVVKECLLIIDSGTSALSMPKVGIKNLEKQGIPTHKSKVKCDSP